MAEHKVSLHALLEVEADSLNIAKAVVEAAARQLAMSEDSKAFGKFSVAVLDARAAEVKGPREKKNYQRDTPGDTPMKNSDNCK